jgi:hypothetical protein
MQKKKMPANYALKSVQSYLYGFRKGAKIPGRRACSEIRTISNSY